MNPSLEQAILAAAAPLGFTPEPGSIVIPCNGGPLLFRVIPGLLPTYPRLLVVGPHNAAVFESDRIRSAPKKLVWSGEREGIRLRSVLGGLLTSAQLAESDDRVVFIDVRSEARRLRGFVGDPQQ